LPNWDGLAPSTNQNDYPNFPQYSDGFGPSATETNAEGLTLYLDDLAKFGNDIDLRTSGNDTTGVSYNDPEFLKQNLNTYTVGFAISNQMLQDAAHYGQGEYYTASNADQLTTALQAALNDIAARSGSFSSATLNSTSVSASSRLFQASFNSAEWSGDLKAIPISSGPGGACPAVAVGGLCPDQWSASSVLASTIPNDRQILTYNPSTRAGISFRWASLTDTQKALLSDTPGTAPPTGAAATKAQQRLDYIRGDHAQESPTSFRPRNNKRLGDIISSDPLYVGTPDAALPISGYSTFRATNMSRTPVVYVGANDGMLHGFNANTGA
jgi:type IV pilus assembly protein PilY1